LKDAAKQEVSRAQLPTVVRDTFDVHEDHPVKFGGSPTALENKGSLTTLRIARSAFGGGLINTNLKGVEVLDEELRELVAQVLPVSKAGDLEALRALAAARGTPLPADYLEYMAYSDGGEGPVGEGWIHLWPVWRILEFAEGDEPLIYDDFLAFAGDGGNTLYGFDSTRGGEIVEGEYIGLARDEVIPRGDTLTELLQSVAEG